MRVAIVAEYYPRRRDPVLGVWAHRQAVAARDAGAEVRVLALERPLPSLAAVRGGPARARPTELRAFAAPAGARGARRHPRRPRALRRAAARARLRALAPLGPPAARPRADALHAEWPFDLVHAHYAVPWAAAARPWAGRARRAARRLRARRRPARADPPGARHARDRGRGAARRGGRHVQQPRRRSSAPRRSPAATDNMRVVHLGAERAGPAAAASAPSPRSPRSAHVIPRKRHVDVLRALARPARRALGRDRRRAGAARAARARPQRLGVADRVELLGQLAPERRAARARPLPPDGAAERGRGVRRRLRRGARLRRARDRRARARAARRSSPRSARG